MKSGHSNRTNGGPVGAPMRVPRPALPVFNPTSRDAFDDFVIGESAIWHASYGEFPFQFIVELYNTYQEDEL